MKTKTFNTKKTEASISNAVVFKLAVLFLGFVGLMQPAHSQDVYETFSFNQPPILSIQLSELPAHCYDYATGQASVVIAGGSEPYSILWSNNETGIVILDVPAGIYSVTVRDDENCSITDSIAVTQPDEVYIPVVLKSTSDLLICTDSGYYYQWYYNGEPIEGENKQFLLTLPADQNDGYYQVQIWEHPDCKRMGTPYYFANKNQASGSGKQADIHIYPNPAEKSITVEIEGLEPGTLILRCLNTTGEVVFSRQLTYETGRFSYKLNIETWKPGVYYIDALSKKQLKNRGVFIKK